MAFLQKTIYRDVEAKLACEKQLVQSELQTLGFSARGLDQHGHRMREMRVWAKRQENSHSQAGTGCTGLIYNAANRGLSEHFAVSILLVDSTG